jgi:dTDP-4-amino-4,6-dideoxygalactose transaminase
MSAALGQAQITRLDQMIMKRAVVAEWYTERLSANASIQVPTISPTTSRMSWFVYVIKFTDNIDRDRVAEELSLRGIPARPYFLPIHLQPYMVSRFGYKVGDFPVTEDLGRRSLALPFSSVMTESQVDYVCESIEYVINKL